MAKMKQTNVVARALSDGRTAVVTRHDVARAAGVSLPTVSFALIDHPRASAKTRRPVLETAQRLGYVTNHAARRLARARTPRKKSSFEQIGFLYVASGDFTLDAVCIAMMHGAERALTSLGACLIFVRADEQEWDKVESIVRSGLVDAWLVAGRIDDRIIERLKRFHLPHVVLGDHKCAKPV